ncbi:hypothetical protein [Streptomyces sp. NPDC059479]
MAEESSNSWAAEAIRRVRAVGPRVTPIPLRPLSAIRGIEICLEGE